MLPITELKIFAKHFTATVPVLLLLLVFSLNPQAAWSGANNNTPTLLVLGDSLSAAHGIEIQQGWVSILEQQLTGTQHYQVINASISGETSGGGLKRLPNLLANHQPDIVIIELGANDGLRGYPVPTLRENLSRMIKLSQQAGAKVLLLGIQIPPNYGSRYTSIFYQSYSLLAEQFSIPLVPFMLENIAVHPELMQSDGLHPTAQAQATIVQNVMPYLKKIL
jgi:acyl-CoA thioesterase-1